MNTRSTAQTALADLLDSYKASAHRQLPEDEGYTDKERKELVLTATTTMGNAIDDMRMDSGQDERDPITVEDIFDSAEYVDEPWKAKLDEIRSRKR